MRVKPFLSQYRCRIKRLFNKLFNAGISVTFMISLFLVIPAAYLLVSAGVVLGCACFSCVCRCINGLAAWVRVLSQTVLAAEKQAS